MKKTLITGLAALAMALCAVAQNSINLPYSQFGIGLGDMPYNMPMAARLGGAVYTRSGNNYVNPFNPASYAGIEKESFVFDMGFNIQFSTHSNGDNSQFDANGNVGYLAVAFPLTSWWKLAGGLMPYSTSGYKSVMSQSGEYGTMQTEYTGNPGGVNQIFLGSAFNIPVWEGAKLQAGFNVKYLTGSMQRAISYSFTDNTVSHWVNSRRMKKTLVNNVIFDAGLQLRQPLGERFTLGIGLTYKPYQDMTVRDTALIYTYQSSSEQLIDTIFPMRGDDAGFRSRLEQSHTFGIGVSLERNGRWLVAADATFARWNGLMYTEDESHLVFGHSALRKGPYSQFALAFERMGNMDAETYWGRIGWSIGSHVALGSMYLSLSEGDYTVNEAGVGAGMSLPMRKGRSLLTLSVAYSTFGSSDVLMRECFTIGIAVSSCERWFVKRKYN